MRLALILAAVLGVGGLVYLSNTLLRGGSTTGQAQQSASLPQSLQRDVGFFITPSGRIACRWATESGGSESIECGVATGLHPPIPRSAPDCKRLPYVGRVAIAATGRVQLIACDAGNGPFADPGSTVYLRYGRTWRAKDISCREAVTGLTCRNRDGHGFFLSIFHWFGF